jgi:chromosome segregation ATPase
MRPPEIEDAAIIDAGNSLIEDGRRVTGFALRKVVGGGNPSRLVRVWEDHQRAQQVIENEPVQELPIEVEEALNLMTGSFLEEIRALAQNLNAKAVNTAERRVADVIRSARERQESAEAELVDAASTVEDLEDQLEYVRNESFKAKSELKKVQEEVEALRKHSTDLELDLAVSLEKASREHDQRKAAEASLKELHGLNADLKADKDDLRVERDEVKKEVVELRSRIESVETERDTLEKAKTEVQARLTSQSERAETALKQIDQLKAERDEARTSQTNLKAEALELEVQARHYKEQLEKLMERFSITD